MKRRPSGAGCLMPLAFFLSGGAFMLGASAGSVWIALTGAGLLFLGAWLLDVHEREVRDQEP